ncbi:signal peptidase I [Kordia sp. YSTF-M3]|uniref:Signal peptidase I n=1 Tax=Kordia aestuariivivens TaxID=2759037 RepID=A0ABR7Q589_9FLAO|nr:signal peptidase I [Kordia aestuariivivens]MBC8753722.1 signal peptidase I [Kordia aestuariivivens]
MTFTQAFLIFFLIVQVIHFLGTWKLYVKAGRKAWEAAVPIYNAFVLMRIINRPKEWYWVILLFIPIIQLIVFPVIWVETIRAFGRTERMETILVVVTLGLYIYYVNYMLDVEYVHERSLKPRSSAGEWIASILFAVVAATLVHTYVMQPFVIPSSSLEKTLLVGDFLFVSKVHYGPRTPMTSVALPMVHDAIPFTGMKSYLKEPQLPYFRFPGFESIERNDIVVFNWPADTLTVITDPNSKVIHKPLDKRSNYVKRCVGLPGDQLEVRDGYVFTNGTQNVLPNRAKLQFKYIVYTKGQGFNPQYMHDRYDITDSFGSYSDNPNVYIFPGLTEATAEELKNHPNVARVQKYIEQAGQIDTSVFPHNDNYQWNNSNFGPIDIPARGTTVQLTLENIPLYKRAISEYEGKNLTVEDNQIKIDDRVITSYTFEQDYYWMMGDNRGNSQDSRSWGFVPFDHVLGKPVFVWMSWDTNGKGFNKIRWNRLFTTVSGDGAPVSYFKYFLILLGGWFVFNYFRKKKKKA